MTALFLAELPVAEVYTFDEKLGIVVQEDLGDALLRNVLNDSTAERRDDLLNEAISLITRIQATTQRLLTRIRLLRA